MLEGVGMTTEIDLVAPKATVSPPDGALIAAHTPIVITFDEPMQPEVVLSGLGDFSDGALWSGNVLTLRPTLSWPDGVTSLSVSARDTAGNVVLLVLVYQVDAVPPIIVATPASGALLDVGQPIALGLSSDTVATSLALSGALADQAPVAQWGAPGVSLLPSGGWQKGAGLGLSVTVHDAAGNSASLALEYDVGTIHVDDDAVGDCIWGTDCALNAGTRAAPFRTIHAAQALAVARGFTDAEIHVAEGEYDADVASSAYGPVVLIEGISLYGGYGTGWTMRNPGFISTITGRGASSPTRAVESGPGITRATVVDGFVLTTEGATQCPLYLTDGAPTISGNKIFGQVTADTASSTGVCILAGAPHLVDNDIAGFGVSIAPPPASRPATGVSCVTGNPLLEGNDISASWVPEAVVSVARGLIISGGTPEVSGGTISASANDSGSALAMHVSAGTASIQGTQFLAVNGSVTRGVQVYGGNLQLSGVTIGGGAGTHSARGLNFDGGTVEISSESLVYGRSSGECPMASNCETNGIYCTTGNLTLVDSQIWGSSTSTPQNPFAWGLYIDFCTTTAERNTIHSFVGVLGAGGVLFQRATPATFRNNIVLAGLAGVRLLNDSPALIQNNTIIAPEALSFYAGAGVVQNNILLGDGSAGSYCVREYAIDAPVVFDGNVLGDCPSHGYYDKDTDKNYVDVCPAVCGATSVGRVCNFSASGPTCDNLAAPTNSGNVVLPPMLDESHHLTASSPVEIREGGVNLSGEFTTDKAGNPRTEPWSIGAYEY